jgi:hypothetical protein
LPQILLITPVYRRSWTNGLAIPLIFMLTTKVLGIASGRISNASLIEHQPSISLEILLRTFFGFSISVFRRHCFKLLGLVAPILNFITFSPSLTANIPEYG